MSVADAGIINRGLELVLERLRTTGESQRALALRCSIDTATMSRICAVQRRPDFMTARRFRDGIGVPLDAWFEPASKAFRRRLRSLLKAA